MPPPRSASDFEARWQTLGLADVAHALSTEATITAQTLAALGAGEAASAPAAPRPWPTLPRLSLGVPSRAPVDPAALRQHDLELRELIGEGAMGRVHVARQHSLQRTVAIKTLKPRADRDETVRALLHEAVITGGLEHPGVVPVHLLGLDEASGPVLVMKRIDGVDWATLLADPEHPLWRSRPEDRLVANLEILMQVCQAVHFAHSRGIVHRDIKPENVMLGEFGEAYLVDWGIAIRQEDANASGLELVGTPAYMAPEMVSGGPLDARTDVYLLGATLHQILTGRVRHEGATLHAVLANACQSDPVAYGDGVPGALAELCNRATHADPERRPASAFAFRQALADFLQHRGSIALAEEAGQRLRELRALLAASPDRPPADLARSYRLATEARFGFTHALREWSDNAEARAGLADAIGAAVELELRQDHAEAAAALAAELDDPDPELLRRIDEASRRQAEARAEQARLRQLDHDADIRVARRERTQAISLVGLVGFCLTVWAWTRSDPTELTPRVVLYIGLVCLASGVVVVGLFRRFLLGNAMNRRLMSMLLVALGALVLNRSVGLALELPPDRILQQDLVLLTALLALGSAVLVRGFLVAAALCLAALVYTLREPAHTQTLFGGVMVLCIPALLLALWLHARNQNEARG